MIKIFIILSIILGGCNPLFGVGSLLHAVATGNTAAQLIGATDIVIEKKTGRSFKEHVWSNINTPEPIEKEKEEEKDKGPNIVWQFIKMEGNNK